MRGHSWFWRYTRSEKFGNAQPTTLARPDPKREPCAAAYLGLPIRVYKGSDPDRRAPHYVVGSGGILTLTSRSRYARAIANMETGTVTRSPKPSAKNPKIFLKRIARRSRSKFS